ncbi:MAG: exodeoxyribonuclease VII small subunit [Lachnospiraceae bacterium]|nr:exodeoxyribonuclease VII small subunit [Dorea sp.]MCI9176952.1 exodeoxyribonuclease VII small subunit [Lachnospiraceae bacterium]
MSGKDREPEDNRTLQDIFAQLDEVIEGMEQEEVSLEETFELYHKGMDMLKLCSDKIDKVEKKILLLDDEGEEHEFES